MESFLFHYAGAAAVLRECMTGNGTPVSLFNEKMKKMRILLAQIEISIYDSDMWWKGTLLLGVLLPTDLG